MRLFNLMLEASPGEGAMGITDEDGPSVAGAFVTAWVIAVDADDALSAAVTQVLESNWTPGRVHHVREIEPGSVAADHGSRVYVEEALECGCSIVFHMHPDDDGSDDDGTDGDAADDTHDADGGGDVDDDSR